MAVKGEQVSQHEHLSPEGLTGPQVKMVKILIGTGMLDVLNPDPKRGTPYTLRSYGASPIPLEDIAACFPDEQIDAKRNNDFRWGHFLFDTLGIEKEMQKIPNSNSAWVVLDTEIGRVESLREAGYDVRTAMTISQACACGLRIMSERQAGLQTYIARHNPQVK
jgi:hypothetical protein